jgi:SAM-dependent methyltransferase
MTSVQKGLERVNSYQQPTCLEDFGVHNRSLMTVLRDYYGDKDFGLEKPYFLELGAGRHAAALPDRLCIDIAKDDGIDIAYDINFGIPLPDECVHTIHSNQVLEHIHNIIFLMNECWRVLIPGGTVWHAVPYYTGPHSWGDPQHVRAFTDTSFRYYCMRPDGTPFVENFADYGIECAFELVDQEVIGGNQGLEVTMKKP